MQFGNATTPAEILLLIKAHLEADPPALFTPERVFICGPDSQEFDNRAVDDHYVEIRAPRMEYQQDNWAGGGINTQIIRMPVMFSINSRFDVGRWKALGVALTDSDLGILPAGTAFVRYMNTFQAAVRNLSKLYEPVRPIGTDLMPRDKNNFFRMRVSYEVKFKEDMGV